jgi:hypothetical protein
MKLENYLQRIHYTGPLAPTEATLRQLHRAHLLAIPYENLDIHLGRRLTLEIEHVYTKIVERGRGGWCYEMEEITTQPRYRQVIAEIFGLPPTLADSLWERIWARHLVWKQTQV